MTTVDTDVQNYSWQLAQRAREHTCPLCGTYANYPDAQRRSIDERYVHAGCWPDPTENGREAI